MQIMEGSGPAVYKLEHTTLVQGDNGLMLHGLFRKIASSRHLASQHHPFVARLTDFVGTEYAEPPLWRSVGNPEVVLKSEFVPPENEVP